MPQTFTSPARTTRLDERSFEQLLAAAFVIQEHNRRVEKPAPRVFDFTKAVAAASGLQEEIAPGLLDLPASARLIAERALQVMSAQGAAVGIVVDDFLTYIGAAGSAAGDGGRKFSVPQSLPANCILTGKPLQYSNPDNLPRAFAGKKQLQSLIAAPVIQKETVLGVLELRFSQPRNISAEEIRAAELFAGVVNLAITTAAKKHAADVRHASEKAEPVSSSAFHIKPETQTPAVAEIHETSEKAEPVRSSAFHIKPETQTPAVAEIHETSEKAEPARSSAFYIKPETPAPAVAAADLNRETDAEPVEVLCAGCGRVLFSWESICARCGTTKAESASAASAREPVTSAEISAPPEFTAQLEPSPDDSNDDLRFLSEAHSEIAPPVASLEQAPLEQHASNSLAVAEPIRIVPADAPPVDESATAIESNYPWSSAQNARKWFEDLRQQGPGLSRLEEFWQSQRANIWLGASALVLLFAIVQFIVSPAAPKPAAENSTKVATPQLSFFEGLMVSLGLAEAPPPAVSFAGNPEARVWVDTRTALYYCEGTGQYGKTPGGKFTSQRDAQQDQFEPAHRKVCP